MAAVNVTGKTCPKCGEFKNRGEFWKASNRKDGLKCYCKSCISGENKARRAEARRLKIAGLMNPVQDLRRLRRREAEARLLLLQEVA